MRRAPSPAPAVVAALLVLALPARSFAVGQDERQLSLGAGNGWLGGGGEPADAGPLARLEGEYGVSDTLALHLAFGASFHDRGRGALRAVGAVAGVTYALDVLRVVPF